MKYYNQCSVLNKIFNKNAVKVSYSCMSNLYSRIHHHNMSVLTKSQAKNSNKRKACSRRVKSACLPIRLSAPANESCLPNHCWYKQFLTCMSAMLVVRHKRLYFINSIVGISRSGRATLSGDVREIGCKSRIYGFGVKTNRGC